MPPPHGSPVVPSPVLPVVSGAPVDSIAIVVPLALSDVVTGAVVPVVVMPCVADALPASDAVCDADDVGAPVEPLVVIGAPVDSPADAEPSSFWRPLSPHATAAQSAQPPVTTRMDFCMAPPYHGPRQAARAGQRTLRIRNGSIDCTTGDVKRESDSVSWTAFTGSRPRLVATSVRA